MSLWREEATLHHPRDLSHFSATPRDFRKVISLSHFTTATDRHEWKNHLRVSHISRAMPELNNKGGRQTDWRRAHSLSVSSRWRYYLPRRKSEKGIHLKGTEERNHLSTKKGERRLDLPPGWKGFKLQTYRRHCAPQWADDKCKEVITARNFEKRR